MVAFRSVEQRRAECFSYGTQLRERLLAQYMAKYGYTDRPFLKDVVDDAIEEGLGARVLEEILPLDRYAQSEIVGHRVIVSVNSRAGEIPRVKHTAGVIYVGKWHEAIHVDGHLKPTQGAVAGEPQPLPLFEDVRERVIVCRGTGWQKHENPQWEFTAENGGLAAAIAAADLMRCESFLELLARVKQGGDLGRYAWRLLYDTADHIGVNPPALLRYFGHRGLCRLVTEDGVRSLVADPQLFAGVTWLESEAATAIAMEQP
jgi:hypothetical protein